MQTGLIIIWRTEGSFEKSRVAGGRDAPRFCPTLELGSFSSNTKTRDGGEPSCAQAGQFIIGRTDKKHQAAEALLCSLE